MSKAYSIYEAKARLSELLRKVKEGAEITVTERGTPIAKVIPFPTDDSFHSRIQRLQQSGQIQPRKQKTLQPSDVIVKGGLKRFLEDRE